MDTEKIVQLINIVLRAAGKPEITTEQYNERMAQTNNYNIELYKASTEAARLHMVRAQLYGKHSEVKSSTNPLSRCYFFFMKEEKTDADKEYNEALLAKVNTPEGAREMLQDIIRQAAELPASVYFPATEAEMIANYEKYGPIMDALFNIKNMVEAMNTAGLSMDPEIETFMNTHMGAFEVMGKQASQVNFWGSVFYPFLGGVGYEPLMKATFQNQNDKSPEQQAFQLFADNALAEMHLEAEEAYLTGGLLLRNSGKLDNIKYLTRDLYTLATGATERTRVSTPSAAAKVAIDNAFKGNFVTTEQDRLPRAKDMLDKGMMDESNKEALADANGRMMNIFGSHFVFDEISLKNEVYRQETFKVADYDLPEGCPFTEEEAAAIGMAAFNLPGIGDVSRPDTDIGHRILGNYAFMTENMMSGTPRKGVGTLLNASIDLARNNTVPIINSYMQGDKKPLAEALAGALRNTGLTFNKETQLKANSAFEGKMYEKYMSILNKDPQLMELAVKSRKMTEKDIPLANIAINLSKLFDERSAAIEKFYSEIAAGRIPSAEMKKELALKCMALDFISKQKDLDQNDYLRSPEGSALSDANQKWLKENAGKDPNAMKIFSAKTDEIISNAPISEFMMKLTAPGSIDAILKMVSETEACKKAAAMETDKLIKAMDLGNSTDNQNGTISAEARKEIENKHLLEKFKKTMIFDDHTVKKSGENIRNFVANRLYQPENIAKYSVNSRYQPENIEIFDELSLYTLENIAEDTANLTILCNAAKAAKKDVHMGSSQYDNVEKKLKLILKTNKQLEAKPSLLTGKTGVMEEAYASLISDCNAYLRRKEGQGLLNVDPQSKTGKRIALVNEALKFAKNHKEKFANVKNELNAQAERKEQRELRAEAEKLLYEALTKDTAGPLLKNLNNMAAGNTDPVKGQKIVAQMNVVAKFMKDKKLNAEVCGLEQKDYQQAMDTIKNGGVAKAAQKEPDQPVIQGNAPERV